MEPCIFCRIRDHELPATMQHEDEFCLAFNDINPKGRVHILIVPKKHIPTVSDVEDFEASLMGHLILTAKRLAEKNACKGYRLTFFVGKEGGQEVFHVHLHLIGS